MDIEKNNQLEFNKDIIDDDAIKLKSIIESLLFVSKDNITISKIYSILKNDFSIKKTKIQDLINELKEEYSKKNRGFEIIEIADGYCLKTKKENSLWVQKIVHNVKPDKLSKSALETLSIIAYKQPITRAEIEEIRGVNVDNIMRVLLEKELIYISGKKDVPGKPSMYSTTKHFLVTFGLKNIQELPPLGELNLN